MDTLARAEVMPQGRFASAAVESTLTSDVLTAVNRAAETANEIEKRLYDLRDRLFGSPPTGQGGNDAAKPPEHCFRASHSIRSEALQDTLNSIDRLSMEIANRL